MPVKVPVTMAKKGTNKGKNQKHTKNKKKDNTRAFVV